MIKPVILRKLESITDLPTIPVYISRILHKIDQDDANATALAKLIETDQSLTARVLRVANSPFYGFSRKISTIDLAVVVLGSNSIKEIVLSLVVQKFFTKINPNLFDAPAFWEYSVFCGSASRLMARKLKYKLAGEAFVAGLMHDIGILIIVEYFPNEFRTIRELIDNLELNLSEAEEKVLGTNHSEVGAWLARKWNLPDKLIFAIRNHHVPFFEIDTIESFSANKNAYAEELDTINQPLTAIVSLSEWFAEILGFKEWLGEKKKSRYYMDGSIFGNISASEILDSESEIALLRQEIVEEFNKASIFASMA